MIYTELLRSLSRYVLCAILAGFFFFEELSNALQIGFGILVMISPALLAESVLSPIRKGLPDDSAMSRARACACLSIGAGALLVPLRLAIDNPEICGLTYSLALLLCAVALAAEAYRAVLNELCIERFLSLLLLFTVLLLSGGPLFHADELLTYWMLLLICSVFGVSVLKDAPGFSKIHAIAVPALCWAMAVALA